MNTKRKPKNIRRAMLAKVHIAKKELGLDEGLYRIILRDEFGVESAAYLSVDELEQLVRRFESKGWKSKSRRDLQDRQDTKGKTKDSQAEVLKDRIGEELLYTDFDESRLRGLVRKICGVDDLKWCGDAVRLKQLLAVIGRMKDAGEIERMGHG